MRKAKAILNHLYTGRAIEMAAALGEQWYDPNVISNFPVNGIDTTGGGCHIPG